MKLKYYPEQEREHELCTLMNKKGKKK